MSRRSSFSYEANLYAQAMQEPRYLDDPLSAYLDSAFSSSDSSSTSSYDAGSPFFSSPLLGYASLGGASALTSPDPLQSTFPNPFVQQPYLGYDASYSTSGNDGKKPPAMSSNSYYGSGLPGFQPSASMYGASFGASLPASPAPSGSSYGSGSGSGKQRTKPKTRRTPPVSEPSANPNE